MPQAAKERPRTREKHRNQRIGESVGKAAATLKEANGVCKDRDAVLDHRCKGVMNGALTSIVIGRSA